MAGEKFTTVLKGDVNWTDWITEVESRARTSDIWQYVDPKQPKEPRQPKVWFQVIIPPDLEGELEGEEITKAQREDIQKAEFSNYKKEYSRFTALIKESLAQAIKEQVLHQFSPYQILRDLSDQYKPSPTMEKQRIDKQVQEAFDKGLARTNTLAYMTNMATLFKKAQRHSSRHGEDAFIIETKNAFRKKHPELSGGVDGWHRMNKTATYLQLLTEIREACTESGMVFNEKDDADLNAATIEAPNQSNSKPRGPWKERLPPLCFCGEKHWWGDCKYVNYEGLKVRKPDDTKMKEIENKLKKDSKLCDRIKVSVERTNQIRKEQAEKASDTTPKDKKTEDLTCIVFDKEYKPKTNHNKVITVPTLQDRSYIVFQDQTYITQQEEQPYKPWIVDGGSTAHICTDINLFQDDLVETTGGLDMGEGVAAERGRGTVILKLRDLDGQVRSLTLVNTAYVPTFSVNIFSARLAARAGIQVQQWRDIIANARGEDLFLLGDHRGLHTLQVIKDHRDCTYTVSSYTKPQATASIQTWHRRLGHLKTKDMLDLAQNTKGIHFKEGEEIRQAIKDATTSIAPNPKAKPQICEPCARGQLAAKTSRVPIDVKDKRPFSVIGIDLLVFSKNSAMGSERYLLHIIDLITSYRISTATATRDKQQLIQALDHMVQRILTEHRVVVVKAYIDGEGGLNSDNCENWAGERGIQLITTAPNMHEQNGRIERSGRTIQDKARTIRIDAGLPESLWPEITIHATRILNATPKQKLGGKTPFEILNGKKPELGHIRIIGSKAYSRIPPEKQVSGNKLAERATVGWLIGQESHAIARIWDPETKQIYRVRDIVIDESILYKDRDIKQDTTNANGNSNKQPIPFADEVILDEIYTSEGTASMRQFHTTTISDVIREDIATEQSNQKQPDNTGLLTPATTTGDSGTPRGQTPIEIHQTGPNNVVEDALEAINTEREPPVIPPNRETETQNSNQNPRESVRHRDTSQGVDPTNIIREPRQRRVPKPKDTLYTFLVTNSINDICLNTFEENPTSNRIIPTQPPILSNPSKLHLTKAPPVPKNHWDVVDHAHRPEWEMAEQAEIASLRAMTAFTETPINQSQTSLLKQRKPIPLKWVYAYKTDAEGFITKRKARLVARGDMAPISSEDVYASTLAYRTFRILLAIITYFDLETVQLDIETAYLNAMLPPETEVYVAQPPGYRTGDNLCWRVNRALYGLRESARLWYNDLSAKLKAAGYNPIAEDPCLFLHQEHLIFIFIYVDDIVLAAPSKHLLDIQTLIQYIKDQYKLRELGELSIFLNIQIYRDRKAKKSWFCQSNYIEALCHKRDVFEGRTVTPLSTSQSLEIADTAPDDEFKTDYRRFVGQLSYPSVISRPDITLAVNLLARHVEKPAKHHIEAAARILQYLYTTRYYAIEYSADTPPPTTTDPGSLQDWIKQEYQASSDAAFADDVTTRKSTQGVLIKLFNGPIHWQSIRQRTVTTSTTEAELLALSSVAKETLMIQRLFNNINLTLDQDIVLGCDNKQTVRAITTPGVEFQTKLKHIDIHHFWLRQEIQEGRLRVLWLPTAAMPADGLTKILDKTKHKQFCKHLNLVDIKPLIAQN
jgi:hypothetical protein